MTEHAGYHVDLDATKEWLHKARQLQEMTDLDLGMVEALIMEVDQLRSDRSALTGRQVFRDYTAWRLNASVWRKLYAEATAAHAIPHTAETVAAESAYRKLAELPETKEAQMPEPDVGDYVKEAGGHGFPGGEAPA